MDRFAFAQARRSFGFGRFTRIRSWRFLPCCGEGKGVDQTNQRGVGWLRCCSVFLQFVSKLGNVTIYVVTLSVQFKTDKFEWTQSNYFGGCSSKSQGCCTSIGYDHYLTSVVELSMGNLIFDRDDKTTKRGHQKDTDFIESHHESSKIVTRNRYARKRSGDEALSASVRLPPTLLGYEKCLLMAFIPAFHLLFLRRF